MNKRKDCLKIKTLLKCLPLILVSSCQAWSPAPESDLLEYELKGDVASMRNTSYNLDSTADGYKVTGIETSMSNFYVEFDSAGRKTLLQRFGKDMRPGVREEYTYNGDGQIETKSVIMSDGAVREKSVYSYVRGRLHSLTVTDGSDSLKKYEKYEYFPKDSIRARLSFRGDTVNGYRVVKFDDKGRNIGIVSYTADGRKVMSQIDVVYDSLDRRIFTKSNDLFFREMESKMSYNEDGFRSGLEITGRGRTMTYSFTFRTDEAGNWIERTTYRDGRPLRFEKREIRYR